MNSRKEELISYMIPIFEDMCKLLPCDMRSRSYLNEVIDLDTFDSELAYTIIKDKVSVSDTQLYVFRKMQSDNVVCYACRSRYKELDMFIAFCNHCVALYSIDTWLLFERASETLLNRIKIHCCIDTNETAMSLDKLLEFYIHKLKF